MAEVHMILLDLSDIKIKLTHFVSPLVNTNCHHQLICSFSGEKISITPFTLFSMLPSDLTSYWRYNGSLTTPPCYETVTWTVFQEPIVISKAQVRVSMISSIFWWILPYLAGLAIHCIRSCQTAFFLYSLRHSWISLHLFTNQNWRGQEGRHLRSGILLPSLNF